MNFFVLLNLNMEQKNDVKESENEKDSIKLSLNLNEEKYLLKIYPSRDKINIVFKLEKEKTQTYYYFEKFDLKDFRRTNNLFINDNNITGVYFHLRQLAENYISTLEKKEIRMNILFKEQNNSKQVINFILRKKILSQDRLNPLLVSQIQDNQSKIDVLKQQIIKLDNSLQTKNDVIANINNNMTNINSVINNINIINKSKINSNNSIRSNESNSENTNNTSNNNNDNEEIEEEISGNDSDIHFYQKKEPDSKRSNGKRKKKNKNKYKKVKMAQADANKTNNNDSFFCIESMEVFQNKKTIELLFILNVITILVVLYLVGSIYSLRSNLEYEKVRVEDVMNKLAYLSLVDDSNDDDYVNLRDIFGDNNLDMSLKTRDEGRITSTTKGDYMDERKRKMQDKRKRNNI